MNRFRFNPASEKEEWVYGAERPPFEDPWEWITYMQAQGISRVCCLLSPREIKYYNRTQPLAAAYCSAFGETNLCWAPISDISLCQRKLFETKILPFLKESVANHQKVLVHCNAGYGRTGYILAAWLTWGRKFSVDEALQTVIRLDRNPFEIVEYGAATEPELRRFLTPPGEK